MLYAHAGEVIKSGVLGDIRHIRALWHRNNVRPLLGPDGRQLQEQIGDRTIPRYRDSWRKSIPAEDLTALLERLGPDRRFQIGREPELRTATGA